MSGTETGISGPVLVLNSGSSSLKAGVFTHEPGANFAGERALLTAHASGIGQGGGSLSIRGADGAELAVGRHTLASQEDALREIARALKEHAAEQVPRAIGHRIVHGGPRLMEPTRLTPDVLATLQESIHFAPLHLPGSLRLIEQASRLFPELPQVACFDTAFHRTLPPVARQLPVARPYAEAGLLRYGFHGLSYESLIGQLTVGGERLPDRIVLAHLGSGSSLCAVLRGASVDTTMGMTPSGGIPMATRTGDLDPGALLFMARQGRLSLDALEAEVNHHAGLAGLTNGNGDLQEIEKNMKGGSPDERAAATLAFSIFATAIAKQVVALTISLRGLDLLVFAGGIGEHSAALRAAVVDRLAPFGIRLDPQANADPHGTIHATGSKVPVQILPAQEEVVIASHTRRLAVP